MTFESIYKEYWQKIFRVCMGYVNDHDWAKDITQETFITVWQKLPEFRNESAIGTWIFRIASNQCLRQLEKKNRAQQNELPFRVEEQAEPEAYQESKEERIRFLYKCISELSETDRIIISLELENVKQSEIAQIVGISEANVRVKIHRIKEKLTMKFKKHEH
ncbi:MAG: polymerase, sigma-24 subunit, subfamily [Bacteroidetes bacterium]|nr:polymerase, sigma-24 subunit, subfamily [Bacteroidota bacterium]